jgi:secreted Zn-dependent insulinase-like peptidase
LLAFYRSEYSAGRMTLALTGNASLDQLEHWARQYFAAVPDRALPALVYPSDYLPHKAALRMLRMEPIKDLRQLSLQRCRAFTGAGPTSRLNCWVTSSGARSGSLLAH